MKDKLLNWLYHWGLFVLSIVIVVIYILLSSNLVSNLNINEPTWEDILFNIINLIAAFYIARKVSLWGWEKENQKNQKKIAKTAIRHNRVNLSLILRLIKITKEKKDKVNDELTKQYLNEIQNHLEMLYNGLKNSEADFYEIVNEELKEQKVLEIEISDLLHEIETAQKKIKELSQETEKKDEKIDDLKEKLSVNESKLSKKVLDLPFGLTGPSDTNFIIHDKFEFNDNLFTPPDLDDLLNKNENNPDE